MEDRETPRMCKYGESKMTRIMMATVTHVTSGSGLRKFQADGFLSDRVNVTGLEISFSRPVGILIIISTTLPRLRMIHGMIQNLKILSKWKRGKHTRMKEKNAASRNRMVTATNFQVISERFLNIICQPLHGNREKNKHLQWLF